MHPWGTRLCSPRDKRHTVHSSFFESDIVNQEFLDIYKKLENQMKLWPRFPDFDSAGKKYYISSALELLDQLEICMKRMELSEDPAAKEIVRQYNVQLLEGGMTKSAMFSGYRSQVELYKKVAEQEEILANTNPTELVAFQKSFKRTWNTQMKIPNLLSKIRFEEEPDIVEMLHDSKALKAMGDIIEDSSSIEKYKDRPTLYRGLRRLLDLDRMDEGGSIE